MDFNDQKLNKSFTKTFVAVKEDRQPPDTKLWQLTFPKANSTEPILIDFKDKIDELLTLEMAAQVSGLSESEAKKDYSKFSALESLKYEWKSNRIKKVAINGQTINVPATNYIELSWLKNTTFLMVIYAMPSGRVVLVCRNLNLGQIGIPLPAFYCLSTNLFVKPSLCVARIFFTNYPITSLREPRRLSDVVVAYCSWTANAVI